MQKKIKNSQPQTKFTGSIKKKSVLQNFQKQTSVGVLIKRCSENMQQIFRTSFKNISGGLLLNLHQIIHYYLN